MHVHSEPPPPRSWEQFEELCADLFQSAWADPGLIRYGRTGQAQDGVDILGRHGALYPVGVQCKKKRRWPVSRLTKAEIDAEVKAAKAFKTPLKAFYILTTAPDSTDLQDHIRQINATHRKAKLFEVVLLGWSEIYRRVTLHPAVANKHFGPSQTGARSPLLATLVMAGGKLERSGDDLTLAIQELVQDFRDWPDGHVVVRQRESDALLEKIKAYEGRTLSLNQRRARLKLRTELQRLSDAESRAIRGVTFMMTDPEMTDWLLKIWDPGEDLVLAVEAYLNNEVVRGAKGESQIAAHLRLWPPNLSESDRCSAALSKEDLRAILEIKEMRQQRFGRPLTESVSELPPTVRARVAVPRIVREVVESLDEPRTPLEQMRAEGRFRLGEWLVDLG